MTITTTALLWWPPGRPVVVPEEAKVLQDAV